MCVGCPDPEKLRKAIEDAKAAGLPEPKPEPDPKVQADIAKFFKQTAEAD